MLIIIFQTLWRYPYKIWTHNNLQLTILWLTTNRKRQEHVNYNILICNFVVAIKKTLLLRDFK